MRSILPVTSAFMAANRSACGGAAQRGASAQRAMYKVDIFVMDTHQCTKLKLMRWFSKAMLPAVAALVCSAIAAAPPFTIGQLINDQGQAQGIGQP